MPVAGALIAAGGSAIAGKQQAGAAADAASAQTQAGRDAINAQLAIYNQSRADTLPQQVTGTGALNLLAQLYGLPTYQGGTNTGGITLTNPGATEAKQKKRSFFDKVTDPFNVAKQFGGTSYDPFGLFSSGQTGGGAGSLQFQTGGAAGQIVPGSATGTPDFSAFLNTPDYLVARDEGLRGLDRQLAATGRATLGGSGDADRLKFASNLGTQQFGNFTNNLFRLAGFGSQGNQQLNSLGQNFGQSTGNLLGDIGNARASSYINQANAQANALNGIGQGFGNYLGSRYQAPQVSSGAFAPPSNQFAGTFGSDTGWLNSGYGNG